MEDVLSRLDKFLTYENRLKTFRRKWRVKGAPRCTAENFAKAGFYFVGSRSHPDLVKCFACNKELDGWENDDDPWSEHVRRGKDCPFVKIFSQKERFREKITKKEALQLGIECFKSNIINSVHDSVIIQIKEANEITKKM